MASSDPNTGQWEQLDDSQIASEEIVDFSIGGPAQCAYSPTSEQPAGSDGPTDYVYFGQGISDDQISGLMAESKSAAGNTPIDAIDYSSIGGIGDQAWLNESLAGYVGFRVGVRYVEVQARVGEPRADLSLYNHSQSTALAQAVASQVADAVAGH